MRLSRKPINQQVDKIIMVDPITTGIAGAVAQGTVDYIRQYIQEADDPESAWEDAAEECVLQARVSFRQKYEETQIPNREGLKLDIETIGQSARELEVRGEHIGYHKGRVELLGEFATACADFAGFPTMNTAEGERESRSRLDELGPEILNEVD